MYENKETKDFIKILKEYKKKPITKKSAINFLKNIGVLDKEGNLSENYKNLRI